MFRKQIINTAAACVLLAGLGASAALAEAAWLKTKQGCSVMSLSAESGSGETITWSGACVDGKIDGSGTLVATSGNGTDTYTGTVQNGHLTGQGTFAASNGIKITGSFLNGLSQGQVTLTDEDGIVYTGEIVQGAIEGQGTMTDTSGNKFAGSFQGLQPLNGTVTAPDGKSYPLVNGECPTCP